ncbi:MAG: hypothetical protein N4A35_15750 [Flavobacteriales bacterium]|jgi:mannose-6-phosphate isomerase-like protein (cupin superfamily)|nr:hypothetical protein [Flavobacteriales bacterium]
MDRKLFIKQSLLLTAFASSYQYIHSKDFLIRPKSKDFHRFFMNIRSLSKQYLNQQINDYEWREKTNLEYLNYLNKNEIMNFIDYIDFNQLKKEIDFKGLGRGRVLMDSPINFENENYRLKTQIIGIQKGYAIPPHVHNNMSSISLVLSGELQVSHYNRLSSHQDYLLVEKDSEVYQTPGNWSMVSPIKNNLHWFKALKNDAYLLNINVEGLGNKKAEPGIRVAIEQPDQRANIYRAKIITNDEAQKRYGKL